MGVRPEGRRPLWGSRRHPWGGCVAGGLRGWGAASLCRAGWGAWGTSARRDGHSLTCAGLTLPQFCLEIGRKEFRGGDCQREDGKGCGVFSVTAVSARRCTGRAGAANVSLVPNQQHSSHRQPRLWLRAQTCTAHVCACADPVPGPAPGTAAAVPFPSRGFGSVLRPGTPRCGRVPRTRKGWRRPCLTSRLAQPPPAWRPLPARTVPAVGPGAGGGWGRVGPVGSPHGAGRGAGLSNRLSGSGGQAGAGPRNVTPAPAGAAEPAGAQALIGASR